MKTQSQKKSSPAKITISIRLSNSQIERLDKLVLKKGATRSAHMQIAISAYLDKEGV